MNDLASKYNDLVKQEKAFFKQIDTAELCLIAIFDYTFQYGEVTDKLTLEDMIMAMHQIEMDLRTEMLHLRLEKALVAGELKNSIH